MELRDDYLDRGVIKYEIYGTYKHKLIQIWFDETNTASITNKFSSVTTRYRIIDRDKLNRLGELGEFNLFDACPSCHRRNCCYKIPPGGPGIALRLCATCAGVINRMFEFEYNEPREFMRHLFRQEYPQTGKFLHALKRTIYKHGKLFMLMDCLFIKDIGQLVKINLAQLSQVTRDDFHILMEEFFKRY